MADFLYIAFNVVAFIGLTVFSKAKKFDNLESLVTVLGGGLLLSYAYCLCWNAACDVARASEDGKQQRKAEEAEAEAKRREEELHRAQLEWFRRTTPKEHQP